MKYIEDAPIKNKQLDSFCRNDFVDRFTTSMLEFSNFENFVIALNGEWGSGKTSLLNLIEEEVNERINTANQANCDEKLIKYPVIIHFTPWNILDQEGIIKQFFHSITKDYTSEKLRKVVNSSAFVVTEAVLSIVPKIGKYCKSILNVFKDYLNSVLNYNGDIVEIKEKICELLKKSPYRHIVFIDDIDRLNSQEIRLIIQLVKSVCDFPNVTYVLSFDRSIVSRALEDNVITDGEKYLEKIIQLTINIPSMGENALQKMLSDKLNEILKEHEISIDDTDKHRLKQTYYKGMHKWFNNIRNINRYLNAINFGISAYVKNINIVDYLILTAISTFDPRLLAFICEHRDFFCNELSMTTEQKQKLVEKMKEKLENITDNTSVLSYLFPVLRDGYGEIQDTYKSRGRVCFVDNFDYYFNAQLVGDGILKQDVINTFLSNSLEQNDEYFCSLSDIQYAKYLQCLHGFVADKQWICEIKQQIPYILDRHQQFRCPDYLFDINKGALLKIIGGIVENLSSDDGFEFLHNLIQTSKDYYSLIYLLEDIEKKSEVLEEEIILKLKAELLKRLSEYMTTDEFYNDRHFNTLLIKVEAWDKSVFMNWLNHAISNNKVLKIIDGLVNVSFMYGNSRVGLYRQRFDFIENNLSTIDLKSMIEEFLHNNKGKKLARREILGKILYLMGDGGDEHWTIKEINEFCQKHEIDFVFTDEDMNNCL